MHCFHQVYQVFLQLLILGFIMFQQFHRHSGEPGAMVLSVIIALNAGKPIGIKIVAVNIYYTMPYLYAQLG